MWQEVFRIPIIDRPVYGYGLMLVIGFIAATQLAKYLAARCRLDGEIFVNAAVLALLFGVIGARLSHILESIAANTGEFANNGHSAWDNFKAMLNLSSGGLTFYGGFLLATPVLIFYGIRKKVPLLRGMDIVAPCLMVGLAFGRIGCFANGCCYGEECSLPWGTSFPYGSNAFVEQYERGEISVPPELTDPTRPLNNGMPRLLLKNEIASGIRELENLTPKQKERIPDWSAQLERLKTAQRVYPTVAPTLHAKPVHPTELYSSFNSFLVAALLVAFFSLAPAPGRVFALMLVLEGVSRYTLEMIRVEPPVWGNLSFSMVLGLAFAILGILMWLLCGRLAKHPDHPQGFTPLPAT
jgi:phosphatidylglycerol:prolipoprotein diacylglycerol transferase